MKNLSWRRKLASTLAAAGLLLPSTALAQCALNTNLVTNSGFENVDNSMSMGGYNAVLVLDWTAPTGEGYAYSHDGSLNSMGNPIPDYANGGPLAGGESFYFTSNANSPDNTTTNPISQDIDVSTGACGTLIASGNAFYSLSAFFSSFAAQGDFGTIQVDFLDGGGGVLGGGEITDTDTTTWTQSVGAGRIPVGTTAARVSVFGTALGGGPDGYVDNVELQVTDTVSFPELDLEIARDTGRMTLSNRTGSPVNISGYSITSEVEGVDPANWLSIANNYDADSGGSVDAVNVWTELTNPATFTDLSEADLSSGTGTTLAPDQSIDLGLGWIKSPFEDVLFEYVRGGEVVEGVLGYTGTSYLVGDFNTDGQINSADWMIFRDNQNADLTGQRELAAYLRGDLNADLRNNHTDFVLFVNIYDEVNGEGAFGDMISSLPEPGSLVLVTIAGLALLTSCRRRRSL